MGYQFSKSYLSDPEFEERFLQVGIGYRVLGGIKFYERSRNQGCSLLFKNYKSKV